MVERVVASAFDGQARVYNWDFHGGKWINFSPTHKASNIKIVERDRQFFVKVEPGGTDQKFEFDLPHDVQVTKTGDMIQFAVPDHGDKTGGKLIAIKFNEKHQEEHFTMRASTRINGFTLPIQTAAAPQTGQLRPHPESLSANPRPARIETFSADRFGQHDYQQPTLPNSVGRPNSGGSPATPPAIKARSRTVVNPPRGGHQPASRHSGEQGGFGRKSPLNNLDSSVPVYNPPTVSTNEARGLPPRSPPPQIPPPRSPPPQIPPPSHVPPPQSMGAQDWTPVPKDDVGGYRKGGMMDQGYDRGQENRGHHDDRGHYDDGGRHDNRGHHDVRGRYDDRGGYDNLGSRDDRGRYDNTSFRNDRGRHDNMGSRDDRGRHDNIGSRDDRGRYDNIGSRDDRGRYDNTGSRDDRGHHDDRYYDKGGRYQDSMSYGGNYHDNQRSRHDNRPYDNQQHFSSDSGYHDNQSGRHDDRRGYQYSNNYPQDSYNEWSSATGEWRREERQESYRENYPAEKRGYYDNGRDNYRGRQDYPPLREYHDGVNNKDTGRGSGRGGERGGGRRGERDQYDQYIVQPLSKPVPPMITGEVFGEEMRDASLSLAEYLSKGNVSEARDTFDFIVDLLSQQNEGMTGSFTVAFQEGAKQKEKPINLIVQVEPLSGNPYPLFFEVKQSDTIESLKQQCHNKFKIPKECQYWVIGSKLAEDKNTMSDLQLIDNSTLYLYLQHPHKAKVHKNTMKDVVTVNYKRPTKEELSQAPPPGGYSLEPPPLPAKEPRPPPPNPAPHMLNEPQAVFRDSGEIIPPKAPPPFGGVPVMPVMPVAQRLEPIEQLDGDRSPPRSLAAPLPLPLPLPLPPQEEEKPTWECTTCTFKNFPYRPSCEACLSARPDDYLPPPNYIPCEDEKKFINNDQELLDLLAKEQKEQEEQARKNYEELVNTDAAAIVTNEEEFECPVCFVDIDPGDGIRLRGCLHMVCKDCLKGSVVHSEEAEVTCPYIDENGDCQQPIAQREIREVLSEEELEQYFGRGLRQAEATDPRSFHCKTVDCPEFCFYEDEVNEFRCQNCGHTNCILCKAQHEGMNCQQYQDDLKIKAANDEAAKQTQQMLENMVAQGEAMHCPQCQVIVTKKVGCDWIRCVMCKTEMCWATKGPRWGPKGRGDTSGGCKCGVNGAKCHPQCHNCH